MTRARPTMAEAVAIELRWMDHLGAKKSAGDDSPPVLTRDEVWGRISNQFKDWYRQDARHLLAVIEPYRRTTDPLSPGWRAAQDALRDGPRIARWIGLGTGPASLSGALSYVRPGAEYLEAITYDILGKPHD